MVNKKTFYLLIFFLFVISPPISNRLSSMFEEKPISDETFNNLLKHKENISFYANKYKIPKEVVYATIGSEMNRRVFLKKYIDYYQDLFFKSDLCSELFLNTLINNKSNISKHDIGLGNISINTALEILKKNKEELPKITTKKELTNYLLTNKGNIHIASLIIREGQHLFKRHYKDLNRLNKNAILFSYYKQGNIYYLRYMKNSKLNRPPIPGEGKEILIKIENNFNKKNNGKHKKNNRKAKSTILN